MVSSSGKRKDMSILPIRNLLSVLILQFLYANANANDSSLQTYIVHVETPEGMFLSEKSHDLNTWYRSFLPTATSFNGKSRMVYSYRNVFSGFAAELTSGEVEAMEGKKGFISASLQKKLPLHTTRSPEFLGLYQNTGFWNASNYGSGIIIGILDTGILPGHPSFSDEGMPPPPAKWKGTCEFNFTACNNKLIGARYFVSWDESPVDRNGHGTHAASTAAGRFVGGANVFGNANGTAAGIAPLAHLAVYKACSDECLESDILAAMDAAIEDGVDVMSISFGGFSKAFHEDNIALGAFSAMQKGIFVSCSAGNNGPFHLTLSNEAPWILTTGASTIDRSLTATAVLGNNVELDGESAFQPTNFSSAQLPLVYPGLNTRNPSSFYCSKDTLNTDIKGKIVLCSIDSRTTQVEQGRAVKEAGATAMVIMNMLQDAFSTSVAAHVIPATNIDYEAGEKISNYINSSTSAIPTAKIVFRGTIIGLKNVPMVASFSSRGPSYVSRGILKPDIIGPGANILGAWIDNPGEATFNIISGTSVSSAHLSGVAALIKNIHPDFSPAAIKSAIMTTADIVNLENQPILDEKHLPADIFASGAGIVNPANASDPGLVYDIQPEDYIPYLCGLNYTNREVSKIVLQRVNCSTNFAISQGQLNYPSFALRFGETDQRFTRTVTNVGEANESYIVDIVSPEGFEVSVNPPRLDFSWKHQKLMYEAVFSVPANQGPFRVSQGYIIWKSGKHSVRSRFAASDV